MKISQVAKTTPEKNDDRPRLTRGVSGTSPPQLKIGSVALIHDYVAFLLALAIRGVILISIGFTAHTFGDEKATKTDLGKLNQEHKGGSFNLLSSLGPRYIEIRAIRGKKWAIAEQNPEQILALIRHIRSELGEPFNLFSFIEGELTPDMKIGSMTLDDYLIEAERASGGQILPNLNLDHYINPYNNGRYHTADGKLGPEAFWKISSNMLSLKAIARKPHCALLQSWCTFNRSAPNPKYSDPASIKRILQEIKSSGWGAIVPDDLGPFFPDYGTADGIYAGLHFPKKRAAPWMTADMKVISQAREQEPYLSTFLVSFNSQAKICPLQSEMDQFLANLDTEQKAVALNSLAKNQAAGGYTVVYPVAIFADDIRRHPCNDANGNPGYWDATKARQTNGKPFMDLIISLMKQYNTGSGLGAKP